MKVCSCCRQDKPHSEFGAKKSTKDGLRDTCMECTREKATLYNQEKAEFLGLLKVMLGCSDCGYDTSALALDFDHLPQYDKEFTVANSAAVGFGRALKEIEKCEVVCANCHRIRSNLRLRDGRSQADKDSCLTNGRLYSYVPKLIRGVV